MSLLFPDTHPEAEAFLLQLLREAPSWRKKEILDQLNQSVKLLAETGLKQRYPQADDDLIRHLLAELLLGEDLAQKAYGQLPSVAEYFECVESTGW